MPDVAFILPDFRMGGAEKVALCVIEYLVSQGCSVDLVLLRRDGELLGMLPPEVKIVDLGARRIRNAVRPLIRYLAQQKPGTIQASMWPITIIAIVANFLAGRRAKVVVSNHAILSAEFPSRFRRAMIGSTTKLFYPFADARIAVSRGAGDDAAALSSLSPAEFTVVHNPIHLPSKISGDARTEAAWDGAALRILTVGRLKAIKDQALLIRAVARIPSEIHARLVIAGSGELESELKALAMQEGVTDRVCFIGSVEDPWPLYATAHVFVLPSHEESFGNVLVEALHAGLPIVSTPTVGAREVLSDGRYGTLIDDPTPDKLAATIVATAAIEPDRPALKDRAQQLSGEASLEAYKALLCAC